jgi:hypothetical protein
MGASVKIMLSYDYCHFEICKSTDQAVTDPEIDAMRKDCQRLADKAVHQYQLAKVCQQKRAQDRCERADLEREVNCIVHDIPPDAQSPEDKAKIKALADTRWAERHRYDYEDEFAEPEDFEDEL